MRGRRLGISVILCIILCLSDLEQAIADYIPPCQLMDGAQFIDFPKNVPPQIVDELIAHTGKLAAPDEDFDATDIVMTRISHRLIWAAKKAKRWGVAYEHGGIGYHDHIVVYEAGGLNGQISFVGRSAVFPQDVCREANAGLNGEPLRGFKPMDRDW